MPISRKINFLHHLKRYLYLLLSTEAFLYVWGLSIGFSRLITIILLSPSSKNTNLSNNHQIIWISSRSTTNMMYDDEQMLSFWRFSSKGGIINVILSSEWFHEAKIVPVNINFRKHSTNAWWCILHYKGAKTQW